MTFVEWFKLLWPIALILGGFGIRLEVARALTKQSMREIEKDILSGQVAAEKSIAGVHARLSRHEEDTKTVLAEIRGDIKTLLQRHQ